MKAWLKVILESKKMQLVVIALSAVCVVGAGVAVPLLIRQDSSENPAVQTLAEDGYDPDGGGQGAAAIMETETDAFFVHDMADDQDDHLIVGSTYVSKPSGNSDTKTSGGNAGSGQTNTEPSDPNKPDNPNNSNNDPQDPAKVYYSVKFVTNSGDSISDRKYESGSLLGELPAAQKMNALFNGWFYDEQLSRQVSQNDVVTKDLTLYAKYEPLKELEYEENAAACIENDVHAGFTIGIVSDEAMTIENAQKYISVKNITDPDKEDVMLLSGSGDRFMLAFSGDGFDPGASYKVVLEDDRLHFEGALDGIREYDFTAYAEEVNNMKYSDEIIYLSTDQFSDITVNGERADQFSIALFSVGEGEQPAAALKGTFRSQENLNVADVVVLYEGVRPDQRTSETPDDQCGDVAYVEITSADGGTYAFKQAESEDVIFTPDMLPVNQDADKDTADGSILTIAKDDMVYTDDVYTNIGLDSQTTIDVGDFIVFYQGEFDAGNASGTSYAEITEISEDGDDYVIKYNIVDWDYVAATMDIYAKENVDIGEDMDAAAVAKIESDVKQQAIESGFAEEAGMYLASLAMATDTFTKITEDMDLSDYRITLDDGTPLDPSEVQLMASGGKVEVDKPKVNVKLSKYLKEFENVNGLRLTLQISTTITIHASDSADIKIELSGDFVQEISLDVGLKAKAIWKVWGIFPYIAEYRVNASVDLYEYTGIGIRADITTGEAEEDDDNDDDNDEGSSLADQVKELLEKFESGDDDEDEDVSISTALVEKYKAMLENESDWVELYRYEIYTKEFYVTNEVPIVAIAMEADFVIQLNANVSIGMDFYYKNAKRYNYTFNLFGKTVQNEVINLCEEQYEFDFYVMGALGIRAGVELQMNIGLFSTKLDSVGVAAQAGAYVKLWGYFWYKLEYTESSGRSQYYCGALYIQVGAYLEINLNAQVLNGKYSKSLNLFEKEWPLWDVGMKENILDFVTEKEDMPEIKLKQYIKDAVISDDVFEMNYLDLVEGDEKTKIYDDQISSGFFTITFTNDKFKYDAATNVVSVVPADDDVKLEGDMIITWNPAPLAFSSTPIRRTIHISWDNLRDGYVIVPYTNGGSYIPIIVESYGKEISQPADPERKGYVFDGWYTDEAFTEAYDFPEIMGNVDTTIYAKWEEAIDTPYTVRYYLQNLESDEYTLVKTSEGTGRTNSVVRPMPEVFEGYTTPEAEELTILADGSAVLNYYYDRVIRHVTFTPGVVEGDDEVYELKYGASVTAPVFAASGYVFVGWDKEVVSTMGAEDVTYTALWEKETVPYRIEYYVQNMDGKFRLAETISERAVPGTSYTADALRKDDTYSHPEEQIGFTSVSVNGVDISQTPEKTAVIAADGNTVIKVNYGRTPVVVTFRTNNQTEDIEEKYYVNQTVEFPSVTRDGYIFRGWYKDEACTEAAVKGEKAAEGLIFYAKWEEKASVVIEHYVMDVDGNYQDAVKKVSVTDVEKDDQLSVADYIESDLLIAGGIEFEKAVCGDMQNVESVSVAPGKNVLQLYYARRSYSLTWNLDGGEASGSYSESGSYYYGAPITAPVLTKRGYTYEWDQTPVTTMPAGDVSYQAVWTETDRIVVKFISDDNTEIEVCRGIEGDALTAPQAPERSGYTFVGWSQEVPEVYPSENMVITARYEKIEYTITYQMDGGSFGEIVAPASYNIESDNISLPVPVKKGRTFEGWYLDQNCAGDAVTVIAKGSTGDQVLYAKWKIHTYKIAFNGRDADNASEPMVTQYAVYDHGTKLPASIYTKQGYVFAGWTTLKDGQRVMFKDQSEISNLTDEDDGVVTLYAVFEQGYTLSYENLGDAELEEDVIRFFTKDDAVITLSAPVKNKTGYTFAGWYLSQDLEESSKTEVITPGTMQRNITVYAKWTANPYSVTFDANLKSGSGESTQMFAYDTAATLSAFSEMNFENPGYAFMGWTLEQNSGRVDFKDNEKIVNLTQSGNVRLYAVWQEITYTITYDFGTGSASAGNNGTYTINSEDIQLQTPANIKEGYQFLGWYDEDLKEYVTTIQHGTYGNRTLTAKWAHGGLFDIEYQSTTDGVSTYRIVRHMPENATMTTDVQHVYYRTENGTAIGGTAKAINFLHVGGPEVFVTFTAEDGEGSYREIKVTGENTTTAFTPNGSDQYLALAVAGQIGSATPEKYYYVKITDVLSTEGQCAGSPGTNAKVRRVIPQSGNTVSTSVFDTAYSSKAHSGEHKITDGGFSKNLSFNYNFNTIFDTFDPGVSQVVRDYLEETVTSYGYYLKSTVREAYDGYQYIKFMAYNGSYITYRFEIDDGKTCKDWTTIRMPATGINQGKVEKFKKHETSGNGLWSMYSGSSEYVKIPVSSKGLIVQFDASGSGNDNWWIKDINEYLILIDEKAPKQVSVAPMSFGHYKAGEQITISVVFDELLMKYTDSGNLVSRLNSAGIPAAGASIRTMSETKGTNVVNIDVVLSRDFEVTTSLNEKLLANTTLLDGQATDLINNSSY